MKSEKKKTTEMFFRRVFLIGSMWNIISMLIGVIFQKQLFSYMGFPDPHYMVFYKSLCILALVFGVGLFFVYRDLYNNNNIVIMSMIEKLGFSFYAFYYHDPWPVILVAMVDITFVILFALFLEHARTIRKYGNSFAGTDKI